MAKNDTKTIFNVLSAKARKKEITNTDRKEVRQAVADLAAEIQGGYRLGRQEFDTFNRVYDVYREDMNEAFRNLPDESRNALGSALTAVRDAVQQTAPAQPAPENSAEEPASAPEPTPEQDSSAAETAEAPTLDLSVLNKDPKEMTDADRQILQNIINSPYTTETAKASARILADGNPLPEQPAPEQPSPEPGAAAEPIPEPEPENSADAPTLDLSVLNKDPKDMTDADRQILQNIINSAYTTATAKANARILASGNPLPEQPSLEPENSAEDRQAALDSITTEKKPWTYSAGTITPAAIAAAMASNEPDKALSNIDDLVAAQAYYKDDKDKSAQLNPIVENRLKNLSLSDITPTNAESYRLLCLQCGNEELRQQALNLIADAIIQYDKEHFGSFRPNTEELAANYDKAHAGLKDKDPFACKHDPDKDTIDLGSVEFTDAAGKPLSEKEAQKQKAAISALAREMAAQRLAKQGSYTPEELEQAYKDAAAEIVWGSQPKYGKNGKPQVDKDALASTIANQYLETETFKDRCKQKFKDNPLVKKVSNNVEKIDKKLEKRYGKKYVYAKQALKFVGKISGSVAKNAAIYGAAGLIPGGTAVVIGYNIYKNWANINKQLKDPNASTAKKCAMVIGACATTALSGLGIASGIGSAAEAINTVSPGMASSAANFMGQLGTYGRMGISAAATMLPNLTESVSLRIQNLSLNRKIKKEKDGEKLQQLIANQKALQVKIKNNKKEMLIKGGSLVAGMAAGQALMPHITELIQESVDNGTEIVKKVAAEHGIDPWKEAQAYANDAYANVPEGTTMLRDRSVYDPDGILRNSPSAQMAAYMAEHDPAMHGAPDEISGIKAHETNLAAAKAENSSGIEGKSAFAHTLQHLESLGDSRITDTNAVAEGISEHVGKNANLATIACKMAPHALQQVLQLEGLPDNNPSSYNMIQYMANHDLTPEQHTALNNFIQNNFDGAQFKAENFADYRAPAHDPFANADQDRLRAGPDEIRKPTLQEEYARAKEARQEYEGLKPHEIPTHPIDVPPTGNKVADYLNDKYACSNDHGVGFKFEPLNESDKRVLGIEEPQQTVVVQQPVQETVVVQQQPQVDIYSDPTLYAQNFGLVYDPYLSNGLNRIGSDTHGGYLGAFIDPRDNSVTLVPNDPLRDKPVHYDSYQSAKGSADHNIGAWDHSGHERNMIYDPDKKITRCFGSGYITHNNTINKVIAGINTAGAVLNTINWIREGRG
jgi:hypothetical protein